jgi:MFS transporter, DHA1 family, tetracycline resistance protein
MTGAEKLPREEALSVSGRRPLAVLFGTVFLDLLGFGIVIPFLPMYAERLGIGAFKIGLILSVYSLMQFLVAPVLGRISDHVGRRPIIMLGLFGSSLSYIIYGFASSFTVLLVSRAVHGACAATVSTAQAYVADTTNEAQRTRGMGLIGAAFGLGFVVGPALGGLLGHRSLRTPVFFAAILTFINLLYAVFALPESHPPAGHGSFPWRHLAEPLLILPRQLARHRMAALFLIAFLATFAMAVFETTFALIAPLIYGYRPAGVGGLLAYAGLVQALTQGYLLGKVAKRFAEVWLIRIGLLLFAVGMAPLASFASPAALFVLLALLSLGYGFANPSIASLISQRTGHHLQGEVLGVNQSAMALARIIGPVAAGLLYGQGGPAVAYVGGGLVALIAMFLAARLQQERTDTTP